MHQRGRLSGLSLTQRLTWLFTLGAAAVVLGLGLLFLGETRRHFDELDHMILHDKRHLVEEILGDAGSQDDARRRLAEAMNSHQGLHVLVRDAQGRAIFRSQGFIEALAAQAQPPASSEGFGTWTQGHEVFHTLSFHRPAGDAAGDVHVLLAAATDHHHAFLAGLRRSLGLYVGAAIALCALLSWLAVRQGLAPLRQMKARAAVVTGQQLSERMPMDAVPVEMADLAQELNGMLDRLQEAIQRLNEYSSDLAHELRTPLSNLLTQTQVALAHERDAPAYREILASNAEEVERRARMVSDMLLLAKTEQGFSLPRGESFQARQEIATLVDFYDATAEDKGIRVRIDGDGEIHGDRLMFRRAIGNLLSNALRHTPTAGDVQIRISRTAAVTEVAVENSGDDIDPNALPRLFERFYRADPARGHLDSESTGLGLAITRAIVEAHGGAAAVGSANGRTRFTLTFPDPPGPSRGPGHREKT